MRLVQLAWDGEEKFGYGGFILSIVAPVVEGPPLLLTVGRQECTGNHWIKDKIVWCIKLPMYLDNVENYQCVGLHKINNEFGKCRKLPMLWGDFHLNLKGRMGISCSVDILNIWYLKPAENHQCVGCKKLSMYLAIAENYQCFRGFFHLNLKGRMGTFAV